MERYARITEKAKREIVLLRGTGCAYRKCLFCDYHTDCHPDEDANFTLNDGVLSRVTGEYGDLEVINSGSVFELDKRTLARIHALCREKNIRKLHFESHYIYRDKIPALRATFADVELKMKLGLETFDYDLRENVLHKGIPAREPNEIAAAFDEANFLFGIRGQTAESMQRDVRLGLRHFERICINIMCANSTAVAPDADVIAAFTSCVYPLYADNERVDILLHNTDFGVGA